MKEHGLQNEIRNEMAGKMLLFRANVGSGWIGDAKKLPGGKVLIENARPFSTGLPPGFSDTFGMQSVVITPDMVGQRVAIFTAMEIKQPGKNPTKAQINFITAVKNAGGRAGVARSIDDAEKIRLGKA